jgi:transcription-repair coupling factor (superfamily II helicase)
MPAGSLSVLRADLEAGFVLPELKIAVVTAADLLGSRAAHETPFGLRDLAAKLDDATLRSGDVVVHWERGVGILRSLETVSAPGMPARDLVRLEYADKKAVLVPVEELASIWKYSSAGPRTTLDRVDGSSWAARRITLEREVGEIARRFVKVARRRAAQRAPKLVPPTAEYERFAARFPFFPTPDQARAIEDVMTDLASGHPMDRLVCGDVGFGKTEVAIRAVAATVFSGKQAAVVVPTTVLARQHLSTFRRRFAAFGIEVGHLSRFAPPAERRAVRDGLADGSVRVVIGTHALAAKGIRFKDLGLLVVDEEQRFGGRDKEKLHSLAEAVHVLTMTATPIPRTLRLAAIGVQKLSIIAIPPARRVPVRTLVGPWNPIAVVRSLRYEHQRGGQSFLVCPRIQDIDSIEKQLLKIVPELEIRILHGKMPARVIDESMLEFADGHGDVLLTTNIIESGLDLPRANTMLVWRADRFGLAQLHQLRGRVGRGSQRGFAHFLLENGIKNAASKRLQILARNSGLGAGFAVSAYDMNLRGPGNLLGQEQAGHLKLVGPDLYRHLLENSFLKASGEAAIDEDLPDLHLDVSGMIPTEYVADEGLRIEIYARLAKAASESVIDEIEDELQDRFGPFPEELRAVTAIARIRLLCARLRVARIDAGPQAIAIAFRTGHPDVMATSHGPDLSWKEGRLVYAKPSDRSERLALVEELLDTLSSC